jgi:hypothetical protein
VNVSDWVELYNPEAASNVDLSNGWELMDDYGNAAIFTGADVLPPMDVSPIPHSINLEDVDGNLKLIWTDPLGIIATGNPVVMDKIEWGPHIGDSEASGRDTIGLDKGAGSVWDPNLPGCVPDLGFKRQVTGSDSDVRDDFWDGLSYCVPVGPQPQPPQLWPPAPIGYLTPIVGDTSTMFVYSFWYADVENHPPDPLNMPTVDIYSLSTGGLPGTPFLMSFISWRPPLFTPDDYVWPAGGALYAYQTLLPAGTDWCYVITATDITGMTNSTAEFCDPDVGDLTAPEISSVLVNNLPSVLVNQGDMVFLTIAVTDVGYGGSNVAGAEWLFTCGPWPGNNTNPQIPPWGDQTSEVGTYNIDTTPLTRGVTYTVYARAWDVPLNYNETCLSTAQISIIDGGDIVAPNILNPLVAPTRVAPGTSVVFTADIDDSSTGMSFVEGANYSINPPALSFPMDAQNPPFGDQFTEPATITIVTTGWPNGPHSLCVVEAWDSSGNSYSGAPVCATVTIDGTPPGVGNVMVDGVAGSHTVNQGDTVDLTATLDDTVTGGSTIANASYTMIPVVPGPAGPSGAMAAVDTTWLDDIIEDVQALAIDTSTMAGDYTVCVFGADEVGNVKTDAPCMTLTVDIPDILPPVVSNVLLNNQAPLTVNAGTTVTLTADVDDSGTGNSPVAGANYTVDGIWPGTDMNPVNVPFGDSPTEPATVDIDTTTWGDATYDICVYGWDDVPNYDTTGACAQLTVTSIVIETEPPQILTPAADPATFQWGTVSSVTLTATIDDTNTGGSNVSGANYTVGQAAWPGTAMNAVTAPFDSISEDVTIPIDVSTWDNGTYDIYIYATDEYGNANLTGAMVTITVSATPVDTTPPTIGIPSVTPSAPEDGDTVTITVTVTDDTSAPEDITVTITITGPGGTPIVTNTAMTLSAGTYTYTSVALTDTGGYSYTITATDEAANSDDRTGTFTVSEKEGDGPEGIPLWMWLLILIIIIVVVVLIIFAATRKKPEEEIIEAPLEEELPPEEEFPPEEEAFVEEEPVEEAVMEEEAPPEEVVEEVPPEEVAEEPAPFEEAEPEPAEEAAPEEAPAEEEAAPGGPISCPNCGTVNPEGISVCTSCGSPL